MNFSEALMLERMKRHKGPPCSVSVFLAGLNEANRADFDAAMADPAIPHVDIARASTKSGLGDVKADAISRHRRGECDCG